MGWNDHFDPSEYDAADPDSMRALADRAMATAPARPISKEDQAWLDALPVGDCWSCSRDNTKIVGKGMCASCYRADKY